MAEIINSNVFDPSTKKFVDFAGLDYFWGKAKAYVDAADKVIADKVAALETTVNDAENGLVKKVNDLRQEVDALGGVEGGISGMIDSAIAELTNAEKTGSLDVAISEVAQSAKDYTDALANGAVKDNTDAIDAVEGDLELHVSDNDRHITAQERINWNKAVEDLDAFLKGEAIEGSTVDTLKEIQDYITSDGTAAAQLVNRVGTLESAVTVINGDGEGSIAKAKADALAAVKDLADSAVKENADAIDVINGDGEGSIAKAKADAIAAAVTQAQTDAAEALKGYYTKTEVDTLLETNSAADQAYAKSYTDALYTSITFASTTDIDGLFNVSAE